MTHSIIQPPFTLKFQQLSGKGSYPSAPAMGQRKRTDPTRSRGHPHVSRRDGFIPGRVIG